MSDDFSAVDPFREELQRLIESEGLTRDQIYNADETGLWWHMTPSSSLNVAGKTRAANFKKAKDRVTLLSCTNASGTHRLPLMLINKSQKPRCFKHMDMNNLPAITMLKVSPGCVSYSLIGSITSLCHPSRGSVVTEALRRKCYSCLTMPLLIHLPHIYLLKMEW